MIIYLFSRGECQHFSGYCEMVKQNRKGQEWREMKKVREKKQFSENIIKYEFLSSIFFLTFKKMQI